MEDEEIIENGAENTPDGSETTDTSESNTQLAKLKSALSARGITMLSDSDLEEELDNARLVINMRRGNSATSEVEDMYKGIQIQLCLEAISKYGAEGESSHNENGVSRVYGNSSAYSPATLRMIIPRIGAF